jgi:glycosyltransferase involved in cell wall biosynthesis
VIPAHNERLNIARCVRASPHPGRPVDAEIVVIADNCDDDTAELAAPPVRAS